MDLLIRFFLLNTLSLLAKKIKCYDGSWFDDGLSLPSSVRRMLRAVDLEFDGCKYFSIRNMPFILMKFKKNTIMFMFHYRLVSCAKPILIKKAQ